MKIKLRKFGKGLLLAILIISNLDGINEAVYADELFYDNSRINTPKDSSANKVNSVNNTVLNTQENIQSENDEAIDSWMPDKNLQTEISKQLNKPVNEITQNDMLSFISIVIKEDKNITSLKGIEYASNLLKFNIVNNHLSDISSLASLSKLTSLDISNDELTDLSSISNLTKLTELHIDRNPNIKDYGCLRQLTNIDYFGARYNDINNINFISSFQKLKRAYLWGNQISDLSPFKTLKNLNVLELDHNQIDNVNELVSLEYLDNLGLSYNRIKNISSLEVLNKLTLINISYNQIYDISYLNEIKTLKQIRAENQTITLSEIEITTPEFTQLSDVKFIDKSIVGLSPDNTGLEHGEISGQSIEWTKLQNKGILKSSWNKTTNATISIQFSGSISLPYISKVKAADVTAKYVDTDGNKISEDVVKSGNVGDNYTTEEKDINGYTFKEVHGNPTGPFSDKTQTVTYVYSKDPEIGGDVTIKYTDEQGNEVSSSQNISGNVGDSYDVSGSQYKLDIPGYTFKEIQGNATGSFTDEAQTVTYVYSKDDTTDDVKPPSSSNDIEGPNDSTNLNYTNLVQKDNESNSKKETDSEKNVLKKELPETGVNNVFSIILMFAGLITLLISIFMGRKQLKK